MKELYREPRSALVIGNGAYASSPLANPVNDAEAMARLLEQRNFKVTRVQNADLRKMEAAVDLFGKSLSAGGVGLGRLFAVDLVVGADVKERDSPLVEREQKDDAVAVGQRDGVFALQASF
jgi:hypothetical protein